MPGNATHAHNLTPLTPGTFVSKVNKGNCMRCKQLIKAGQLIRAVRTSKHLNIKGYIHGSSEDCHKSPSTTQKEGN